MSTPYLLDDKYITNFKIKLRNIHEYFLKKKINTITSEFWTKKYLKICLF